MSNQPWTLPFQPEIPMKDLSAGQVFELIRQAVLEGALQAGQKVRSGTADAVASLLVERR